MPFLRIVRDKRGYEYFSLVQQTSGRRGKVRQQVLYWYRTPPNVKVGRQPLDDDVMRALEGQHPNIQFDWDALRDTPPPLPSVEPWRERRRAERAARQLRDADEPTEPVEPEPGAPAPIAAQTAGGEDEPAVDSAVSEEPAVQVVPISVDGLTPALETPASSGFGDGRRRRHRRRGRRSYAAGSPDGSAVPSTPTESPGSSSTGHEQSGSNDEE